MNGLPENIQHVQKLPHLTCVDYAYQATLPAEKVHAGKINPVLHLLAPTATTFVPNP